MKLPPTASYGGRSGRTNVAVNRKGDTIIVHASCDSLQRQCEYYERETAIYRNAYGTLQSRFEEERERRSNPVKTFFAGFFAGIVITVLGMIIIKNKLKNGN